MPASCSGVTLGTDLQWNSSTTKAEPQEGGNKVKQPTFKQHTCQFFFATFQFPRSYWKEEVVHPTSAFLPLQHLPSVLSANLTCSMLNTSWQLSLCLPFHNWWAYTDSPHHTDVQPLVSVCSLPLHVQCIQILVLLPQHAPITQLGITIITTVILFSSLRITTLTHPNITEKKTWRKSHTASTAGCRINTQFSEMDLHWVLPLLCELHNLWSFTV